MARSENILISSNGIKNSLKKYNSLNSIVEYIWNGFDAKATKVEVNIELNELGKVNSICINDNGTGIEYIMLSQKFKPFYQSEKIYDPAIKHSTTHGKNGVGRLTFFKFSTEAVWKTIYRKESERFSYSITVNDNSLDRYIPSEETKTEDNTGTEVFLKNVFDSELNIDNITSFIAKEFCWFLELHKDDKFSIIINGNVLDYSGSINIKDTKHYIFSGEEGEIEYDVTFVCWTHKLNDYSKYYYVNSKGEELAKENTTLNNKGDSFYHSVFIKSSLFDYFDIKNRQSEKQLSNLNYKNKKSPEYIFIINEVNKLLYDKRKPFLKEHVSVIVESLEIESAFPNYNERNIIYRYKKSQIEELVCSLYIAQPKIFSNFMNKEQKKTFIRMLDLIMESGEVDSLLYILQEILEMDANQREELSEILKFTRMSNITKTIKLIKDRYQAVEDLKSLVFKKELNANEVNHVQKFIEKHYWLFGEQYNLVTAAEPNFEEALKRYLKYLHKEYEDAIIEHPDKMKQMDIFAIRQDVAQGRYNNIIVELKHPDIALGEKQLSQVKTYMNVILSNDEFNAPNMSWEFYLVGNRFSKNGFIEGEIENNKSHGENSLVYSILNGRYKIFVKKWSEIFADFEMKHKYLNEKLELDRNVLQMSYENANQIIDNQINNTAVMPKEMEKANNKICC